MAQPDLLPLQLHRAAVARRGVAQRWLDALLAMSYDDPAQRQAMDLEGVKRWLPGDRDGYAALAEAMAAARRQT